MKEDIQETVLVPEPKIVKQGPTSQHLYDDNEPHCHPPALGDIVAVPFVDKNMVDMDGMDEGSSIASMQNLAMDNTTNNANGVMQNPGGDPASSNNMMSTGTSSTSTPSPADPATATQNGNDEMSADTATGDDDY